jgi:hypothetical protein
MTDPSEVDIQKLSPDGLLTRFRKSGIVLCIIVAFALHVVVLGGTSVPYIHGLVDPAWKAEQDRRKEEARRKAAAEKLARSGKGPAASPATAPATRPAAKSPAGKPAFKPPDGGRRTLPKEITTMPKAGEIPKLPGSGIGIDETEGR